MPEPIRTPTLGQYAALITRVGLTSFGGGISGWMLRLVVHERHWMTETEFLTGLALCQVFPGINVLNLAIWLGYRMHGNRGALIGALAIIIPPAFVIVALYTAFTGLAENVPVRIALDGVAAAAVGLSASMGLRAARRCRTPIAILVLAATFAAVGLLQLPLLAVMAVLVPLSVALAWRRTAPPLGHAGPGR